MCYNLSEVTEMDILFPLLEEIQYGLLQKKMSRLEPCTRAGRDADALWSQFCAAHPKALRRQVLALLDSRDTAAHLERDAAFRLGLQLGLELGGLGRFQEGEG